MNILVVDDESIIAMEIRETLLDLGYPNVITSTTSQKAIDIVKKHDIELVLMDVNLEADMNGIECVMEIKKLDSNIAVVYITSHGSDESVMDEALSTNPITFMNKPYKVLDLKANIKIVENRNKKFKQDNKNLIYFFDGEFSYNQKSKELFHNGVKKSLRKKEEKLLDTVIENISNRFISYEQIDYAVWENDIVNEVTRRRLISDLNIKFNRKLLDSKYGEGWWIIIKD